MYLGLDLGTSGVKALLIDGARQASSARPAARSRCRGRIPAGRSRTRPTGCGATEEAVDELRATHPAGARRTCAASAFPARCMARRCSTRNDRVLRPCILWNDTRSSSPRPRELDADSALSRDHRQHRLPGLHRAEAGVGRGARAGDLRAGRQGAAAEGLSAALADRRARLGDVGLRRHAHGSTSASATGRDALLAATDLGRAQMPTLVEGTEPTGMLRARARRALGHGRARRGRRRRRRQCGFGLRHRHGRARRSAFVSLGTSGVLFVVQRPLSAQPGKRRPRLLPRAARHLAPDGRDPVGDRFAQLAGRDHRHEPARSLTGELGPRAARPRASVDLPALSLRRAHAAQRCRHPRRLHRAWPRDRSRAR